VTSTASSFYRWQKEFFENGAAAFQPKAPPNHSAEQERVAYLEKKIQTKDEVLAELMAEHVALQKSLESSDRGGSKIHASSAAQLPTPKSRTAICAC
jgi:transposase-like protein